MGGAELDRLDKVPVSVLEQLVIDGRYVGLINVADHQKYYNIFGPDQIINLQTTIEAALEKKEIVYQRIDYDCYFLILNAANDDEANELMLNLKSMLESCSIPVANGDESKKAKAKELGLKPDKIKVHAGFESFKGDVIELYQRLSVKIKQKPL